MGKNKTIPGGERTIILRVLRYFEEEKIQKDFVFPVDQVLKRTCAATGVSLSTVTRIKREEKKILQTLPEVSTSPTLVNSPIMVPSTTPTAMTSPPVVPSLTAITLPSNLDQESPCVDTPITDTKTLATYIPKETIKLPTPGKKRGQTPHNKLKIDDSTINSIRNIIQSFYIVKKKMPSLKKILARAKADLDFPGQKESLRKIIVEKLGYSFKKYPSDLNLLMEGPKRKSHCLQLKGKQELSVNLKSIKFKDSEMKNT